MNKNSKRIIVIGLEVFIIVISILLIVIIANYGKKETVANNKTNLLTVDSTDSVWVVSDDTKSLLSDNTELLDVIGDILKEGKEPFTNAKDSSKSIPTVISRADVNTNPVVDFSQLSKSDLVMFQNGLEVIGVYDDSYALYAYNRGTGGSKLLVFVDYSGDLLDSMVVGNSVGFSIVPKCCNCVTMGGYEVLYVLK